MAEDQKRDYYEVLGVDRQASAGELKEALRRRAEQFQAEKESGHPEALANLTQAREAYEVLADPAKRASYDKGGHEEVARAGHKTSSGMFDAVGFVLDVLSDLF
ncbi:MAG: DnaJ domain-containing protein [Acidobacteriia bacterium]|nr:DnaJ domain-containing protein [Terriglobia bacterium]